jgi:hypothetical protein
LSAGKFFWYLLFTLLTLLYYTFYGLLAVVLSPNLQVSSVASTLFYAIWNLFSGFLITLPQMPVRCFSLPACTVLSSPSWHYINGLCVCIFTADATVSSALG